MRIDTKTNLRKHTKDTTNKPSKNFHTKNIFNSYVYA